MPAAVPPSMPSRTSLLQSLVAITLIGSAAAVADAMVITDEERLESFVEAVTGEVEDSRIDGALRYVDTARVPVEVVTGRQVELFQEDEDYDLAEHARNVLAPIEGTQARLLQDTIDIDDDRALVALRVSTAEGVFNAQFRMVRRGDGWLVSRVRIL